MNGKRFFVDLILVAALALLGVYCYRGGKAYDFILENRPYSRGGENAEAMEAVQVAVDGGEPATLYESDVDQAVAVGSGNHTLIIDVLDIEDMPLPGQRRAYTFTVGALGAEKTLNVPFAYAHGKPVR